MPLKKCSQDKQSGWKWGDAGKASQFEENLTQENVQIISEYMIREKVMTLKQS